MATKPDDEIKGWFPTGYEHLESWVTDAQEKIAAIDLAIGNLLSDKGPFPSPRPSDEIPRLTPQGRQSIIVGYNQQKLKLKEELREKIKDATKGADPKTGKIISDKAEFLIDEKAMFNKMSKEKLAGISGEEKNNGG